MVESDELTRIRLAPSSAGWKRTGIRSGLSWIPQERASMDGSIFPNPEVIPSLKQRLTALKCDPSMFGASQPCRLPGAIRKDTARYQRLIYFNQG